MVETESKCSKEVLAKVKIDLAEARSNWASKKEKRELKVTKAKEELAKTKKEAEVMEKYKASSDFTMKKVQAMEIFHSLEEFYVDYRAFS